MYNRFDRSPAIWGAISGAVALGFQVSGYTNVPLAIVLWLIATGLIAYAFRDWLPHGWFKDEISLSDAARITYEQLRGSVAEIAADKFGKSPEGRLNFMATMLLQNDIQLRGAKPPSKILEEITLSGGAYEDGGKSFRHTGGSHVSYTDMVTSKKSLREVLLRLKQNHPIA